MFTHDPFQAYQTIGAFGGATPYGLPYPGIHPLAFAMQPLTNPTIGAYGQYPQQVQGFPQQQQGYPQQLQGGVGIGQQNPWQQLQGWNPGLNPVLAGLQNPIQQHHLGHPGLQNPLLAASLQNPLLQNPLLNPVLAYQAWQQQQTPFQYPLAPQTFVGAGIGQPYGQINPLAQLALRQGAFGLSPFAGY